AIRTLPTAWVPLHRKFRLRLVKGSSGTKGAKDAPQDRRPSMGLSGTDTQGRLNTGRPLNSNPPTEFRAEGLCFNIDFVKKVYYNIKK
ncbi:MAG: hypothetical protein K2P43_15415, partial [Lachnospiraceae bacterium]|nr:hypothetical protein [Lachnospiraceae bacterium]